MSGTDRPPRPDTLITSASNPTLKLARSLHRRKFRERERALLVEGTRSLDAAVAAGAPIRAVLIDAARQQDVDASLMTRLPAEARVLYVDHSLYDSVTLTDHPQPVSAIVGMPDLSVGDDPTLVLLIDGVRDPGNLGTMIRSAAAAGADAVALLPGTADATNPKAIRSTAGALFAIPVRRFNSAADVVGNLFAEKPLVAVADADAERSYDSVDWRRPTVVIIGGEAFGVSEETRTYADIAVAIPIAPGVESLNASVAASILLFEVARRRRMSA